ncbi:hypothetical protein [Halocynthiibacter namhaensis]|uniref:hypothetical protein n=1 Tax=Halocynthiibacter namhaensis TaxID=1290553 RepID=UPI0005795B31|nr:hypothetical protein [Halocynthiibacter namhaensis]
MKNHGQNHLIPVAATIIATGFLAMAAPAQGETSASGATLMIELNTVSETPGGCRLSFLAQNDLSVDLNTLVLETVLFTKDGGVDRLTLFDFQTLPQGRPRLRQFDVSDLSCSALGSILINGVHACAGSDGDTEITTDSCRDALRFNTRTDHEIQG